MWDDEEPRRQPAIERVSTLHYSDYFIFWVLLLWSTLIGDEILGPPGKPKAIPAIIKSASQVSPLKSLDSDLEVAFDKEVFLLSFRRQAAPKLLPCLAQWRPSPDSFGVTAVFSQRGRLSEIRGLGAKADLPPCAMAAISEMIFEESGRSLKNSSITLSWLIEW
jgi:hypothetical protein